MLPFLLHSCYRFCCTVVTIFVAPPLPFLLHFSMPVTGDLLWGASRVFLLGVLYAGPQHTAEGSIKFTAFPRTYTSTPNNLGLVIKSSRLMDFKPSLLLMAERQSTQ
jgi:hypothetical protein